MSDWLLSERILAQWRRPVASVKALVRPLLLHMDGRQIRGWDHIRKFIPLDWSVIFRRTKKSSNDKIAPRRQGKLTGVLNLC